MLLAEATWNGSGTPQYARELVDSIPERFQNWEHRYLRHKYVGGFATLYGHTQPVRSVSFSPDGNRLASGSWDQTIRVWDSRPVPRPGEPLSQDELTFRKAMWRPDPIWHQQQLDAAKQASDTFAERVQNYLFHKAIAEEHFDYNRWHQALAWHVAAQILKPPPGLITRTELLPAEGKANSPAPGR